MVSRAAGARNRRGTDPAATASAAATPVATVSPEEGAKVAAARHEGFEAIGKAMKSVGDELKKPTPNVDTIKAMAGELPTWFPAGSGVEVAPKSEALAVIWEKPAEFQQATQKFVTEAATFNTAAQGGDVAAIGAGMKALGGTCKGCHEQFRKEDK